MGKYLATLSRNRAEDNEVSEIHASLTPRAGNYEDMYGSTNLQNPQKAAHLELILPYAKFYEPSKPSKEVQETGDASELASVVLECRRPDAGFNFGRLRPFWRAAVELTGVEMDSAQLGQWARENAPK